MKKILFILTLIIGFQGYSQKTFEIYNFSSQTITLIDVVTRAGTSYPEFHSKPYGPITIAPGDSYILENTSQVFRFPFNSPASVPYITTWERLNSPTASATSVSSNTAWVLGNSQVFYNFKFLDALNFYREIGVTNTNIPPTNGWQADYDGSSPATNVFYYTVVIYDSI